MDCNFKKSILCYKCASFSPACCLVLQLLITFFYLQGEPTKSVVFLISYWGDQIGQKVKKICDW